MLGHEVRLRCVSLGFSAPERDLGDLVLPEEGSAGHKPSPDVCHMGTPQVVEGENVHRTKPVDAHNGRARGSDGWGQRGKWGDFMHGLCVGRAWNYQVNLAVIE